MNSNDPLETLLLGLAPRRPSAKVRDALFGALAAMPEGPAVARSAPRTRLLHVWFAPLAAVAVVILSFGSFLVPAGGPVVQELAFAALGSGWQSQVGPIEHNLPPSPSFHSTTGAALAPSFGSLLLRQTNALVR